LVPGQVELVPTASRSTSPTPAWRR
jgi:hypothetical protein